ncbi:SacI homology domain-containing protein [Pelagophyceae sp. CCMP2097]|nr:SacI homology domain-containing protein [Pelagophyceae sp. CCMP2097]
MSMPEEPGSCSEPRKLEKFILYQTQAKMYLVGCDKKQLAYRLLKMHRGAAHGGVRLSAFVSEDRCSYSKRELKDILEMIHEGNKSQGGLVRVATGYGVLGFIRFLDCYYVVLVTQRRKVGAIGAHRVFGIKATEMFPIKPEASVAARDTSVFKALVSDVHRRLNPTQREISEQRYVSLFQFIDVTKDFFFSYTYDLTRTLQHNMRRTARQKPLPEGNSMYTWNVHLTNELAEAIGSSSAAAWTLATTHGAFVQRKCSAFGRVVNISLVARRSRHFAGTRYLKRGVSDSGKAANDVELEQIVHEEGAGEGAFSAFVQVRGSIPTFWTQETSVTMPKPPIVLNRVDPTYGASQAHFGELLRRYSAPVMVLDLTKHNEKREREMIVSQEFRRAICHVNSSIFDDGAKVRYCALDFSHISKDRGMNILGALEDVARWTLYETNFFCSMPKALVGADGAVKPLKFAKDERAALRRDHLEQRGVMRTNCIDCLDRSNVAQFTVGVHALGRQLATMGMRSSSSLEAGSQIVVVLMELYSAVGDLISLQYGGSEAHKKMGASGTAQRREQQQRDDANQLAAEALGSTTKHKEILTSIRRYYSNAFTDRLKQDAINVFLGNYVPSDRATPLWELDSDYYLHNVHVQTGTPLSMKPRIEAWLDDDDSDGDDFSTSSDSTPRELAAAKIFGDARPPEGRVLALQSPQLALRANAAAKRRQRRTVVRRSKRLQATLAAWWIEALRAFERDLDGGGEETGVAGLALDFVSRFDAVHQPHKLTKFDKVLSHDFFVPVPLAHDSGEPDAPRRAVFSARAVQSRRMDVFAVHSPTEEDDEATEDTTPLPLPPRRRSFSLLAAAPLLAAPQLRSSDETLATPVKGSPAKDGGSSVSPAKSVSFDAPPDVASPTSPAAAGEAALCAVIRELYPKRGPAAATARAATTRARARSATTPQASESTPSKAPARQRAGSVDATAAASATSTWATRADVLAVADAAFVGSVDRPRSASIGERDYSEYARSSADCSVLGASDDADAPQRASRAAESKAQFTAALGERDVASSDVAAIREISASAGVARILPRGDYAGLSQSFSARDVAAAVFDEVDALTGLGDYGRAGAPKSYAAPDAGALAATVLRLKRRNGADAGTADPPQTAALDAPGVVRQITSKLAALAQARDSYAALLDPVSLSSARSTYSCDASVALYCTFSRGEDWLSDGAMRHVLREGVERPNDAFDAAPFKPQRAKAESAAHACPDTRIYSKAALDEPLSYDLISRIDAAAALRKGRDSRFDAAKLERGFVQVGPDLFARADNRYLLFNTSGALAAVATQADAPA